MRVNGAWLLAIVLVAALVWGLEQVAVAPLETGEVYPPYSSLRSDPLGAKALYESLEALPEISVERLYKPRVPLQDKNAMIFALGVDPHGWSSVDEKTLEEYEKLTRDGGRLVIAFLPVRSLPAEGGGKPSAIQMRWRLKLASRNSGETRARTIPRRSALYFEPASEWKTLSQREGLATAVEREQGAGSIVLVADSYPLSNEGLREERDAESITRLMGPARRVIFDENHFGVVETGSVTKLMRKYRLEGAVAMLALVAALFLWRSASSFLPPRDTCGSGVVMGRDSLEGMSALLRRGIPEKDLLKACFAEWAKSQGGHVTVYRPADGDPVEAYRAACRALTERK